MKIYDSHTHLNHEDLFLNWKIFLNNFIKIGGRGLVNAGANMEYNNKALEISKQANLLFPECQVKSTLGYHPCDVESLGSSPKEAVNQLKKMIQENKEYVVAIGECGIDLHHKTHQKNLHIQQEIFALQCKLANEMNLPIMIHSRDAFNETIAILKKYPNLTIYFHCRGYDTREMQILLSLFPNLFIGFCGNISYPRAENIRSSIKMLDKKRILIETDSPYLTPQKFRGQKNYPERIIEIGSFIAKLLNVNEKEFWKQIEKNFNKLYYH